MRKIVIAGANGFIGHLLAAYYLNEGVEVVGLVRTPHTAPPGTTEALWDGRSLGSWTEYIEGAEALINLCGKSVNCRYTEKNKKAIISSRVDSVKALQQAISMCSIPPKVFITTGSAAIYGNLGNTSLTETDPVAEGFSPAVCKAWEQTFFDHPTPCRKVFLRVGIVLSLQGGALPEYIRISRMGFGLRQGSGNQLQSWIHAHDLIGIIDYCIKNKKMDGVVNTVAPWACTNAELMQGIRKYLTSIHKKPMLQLPMPSWLVKLGTQLAGTEAELILLSRAVVPQKLVDAGYMFAYADIDKAMKNL